MPVRLEAEPRALNRRALLLMTEESHLLAACSQLRRYAEGRRDVAATVPGNEKNACHVSLPVLKLPVPPAGR